MDEGEAAQLRALAQAALRRARLATVPAVKEQWQKLAIAWLHHLADVEQRRAPRTLPTHLGATG